MNVKNILLQLVAETQLRASVVPQALCLASLWMLVSVSRVFPVGQKDSSVLNATYISTCSCDLPSEKGEKVSSLSMQKVLGMHLIGSAHSMFTVKTPHLGR